MQERRKATKRSYSQMMVSEAETETGTDSEGFVVMSSRVGTPREGMSMGTGKRREIRRLRGPWGTGSAASVMSAASAGNGVNGVGGKWDGEEGEGRSRDEEEMDVDLISSPVPRSEGF